MSARTAQEVKLHSTIVNTLKMLYEGQKGAEVSTCNDKVPVSINGVSPDLVAVFRFKVIFKVETESTVTEGSAIEWKSIAEKAGSFYLMVPEPLRFDAKKLLEKNGLTKFVTITTYKIRDNKLVFSNLP